MNNAKIKRAVLACLCAALAIIPMTGCSAEVAPAPEVFMKDTAPKESGQALNLYSHGDTPQEAVSGAFEYLKSLDEPSLCNLLEIYGVTYPYDGSQKLTASIAGEYLRKMNCEVLNVEQDGDTAKVKVKVSSVNIGALVGQVMEKSISMVFSPVYIAKSSSITNEDRAQMMLGIVQEAVTSELPLSEAEYTLNVTYSDGQWEFKPDSETFSPMINGVIEIIGMVK